MYKSIIFAIVMIFFVIGIVTVISWLLIKAACPDKKMRFFVVCPFYPGDTECTVKISCVSGILIALGLAKRCRIAAVDFGMDEKEREMLRSAFSRDDAVVICSAEELCGKISENSREVP